MHPKILVAAIVFGLCACGAVFAQQSPGHDPVGDALFPPELVMSHQQVLGLSDSQKTAIQAALETSQRHFPQAQWQLAGAMEGLGTMLKQPRVDQSEVLVQLDKILGFEREIKRTQLIMMIRIKNALSTEQQTRLQQLKEAGQSRKVSTTRRALEVALRVATVELVPNLGGDFGLHFRCCNS